MLNHRVHTSIKVMVGFVAMLAYAEANEVDEIPVTGTEPMIEYQLIELASDEVIGCTFNSVGFSFFGPGEMELAEAEEIRLAIDPDPQDPEEAQLVIQLYSAVEGKPSEQIAELVADKEAFNTYGTAKVSYPSPEQLFSLNINGNSVSLLVVHDYFGGSESDVDAYCTIFGFADTGFEDTARIAALEATKVKKKVVKRKVAAKKKAVKRKVKKKAVKRKVASRGIGGPR